MATKTYVRSSYGLTEPLINVQQAPIISQRAPTPQDRAQLGTEWVDTVANEVWVITSIVNDMADWVPSAGGASANTFDTDSGTAIPAGGTITMHGGVGINTSGAGSTVTFNLDIPVSIADGGTNTMSFPNTDGVVYFDGTKLTDTAVGTAGQVLTSQGAGMPPHFAANPAASTFNADSGSATPAAGVLTLHGTGDVSTSAAGSTVTFHGEGVTAFIANSGTATATLNAITIDGGTGITTSGAGSIVTVSATGAVPTTFATDSGSATPAANTITMHGGNNISTSGAGSTVTYNVSGTTNHAVQLGNASGSLTSLSVGTTNTVLLGNTGADPSFGQVPNAALVNSSITLSNGSNITVTGSPVSLGGTATIALSGVVPIANGGTNASSMATTDGTVIFDGTRLVTTATGTSGQVLTSNGAGVAPTYQPVSASGAVTSVSGGNNITITGTATAPIVNVSGTTNHAVQVGNSTNSLTSIAVGTTGQVLIGSTGADPAFGALGVNSGLTAHSLVLSQNNSAFTALGAATNGQIPIGSTGVDPVLATITAGSNITITNGAGSITIAANAGAATFNYTSVNHAASPYTVLSTDYYIGADVTAGVISILLPNAPTTGRAFVVKDKAGLAATSNITVTTVGGAVTIDGATSFVMNTAYEAISLIFNGTSYEVY